MSFWLPFAKGALIGLAMFALMALGAFLAGHLPPCPCQCP